MHKALFKKTILFILIVSITLFSTNSVFAQEESRKLKGIVLEIIDESVDDSGGYYQKLRVKLEDIGEIIIEMGLQGSTRKIEYESGDKVVVEKLDVNGEDYYIITDFQRTGHMLFLFLVFASLSILVGGRYGVYSIFAMVFSFFSIFKFIIPQIAMGRNPIFVTIIASLFIIPVTFYLSHGFNKKTHIAIFSTILTLIFTSILTGISVSAARLTGYASEEAMFLKAFSENINMKGILLSGIIIGFLGVLDDVTVSQSSIVEQLKRSKRTYNSGELYKDAMKVGRDHITSMINTLVLVYAGASMPLLLLFYNNPQPIMEVVNMEIIADEVIRTLVGSIGLILAVPLSTFIASNAFGLEE